jgi:hypothetical protein
MMQTSLYWVKTEWHCCCQKNFLYLMGYNILYSRRHKVLRRNNAGVTARPMAR